LPNRLSIFISAGPDLEIEREVVGKAIASLPVSMGWTIKYTPTPGHAADPEMAAAVACDFYVLLLGRDITAPMGSELRIARQTGKKVRAFVKDVPHTPAARVFLKYASADWQDFDKPDDLSNLLQKALMEQILQRPEAYGMTLSDWEALSALSEELEEEPSGRQPGEDSPGGGGAGGDAVIVSPERDLPSDGVLIEKPPRES
jgi:hypothetical protein